MTTITIIGIGGLVVFYFLFFLFLHNRSRFRREISIGQLKETLENLPLEMYPRKISLFVGNGTLQDLIDNPSILNSLLPEDLDNLPANSALFQRRETTLKNNFNRKLFEIPSEALQRKMKLSSKKIFLLKDLKKNPGLLKKFGWKDFVNFSPQGIFFKPRNKKNLIKLTDFKERRNQSIIKTT